MVVIAYLSLSGSGREVGAYSRLGAYSRWGVYLNEYGCDNCDDTYSFYLFLRVLVNMLPVS